MGLFATMPVFMAEKREVHEFLKQANLEIVGTSSKAQTSIYEKEFQSKFARFTINMKKKDLRVNSLYSGRIEFPRVNERVSLGNDYTYSYMCNKRKGSSVFDQILKLNVKTGAVETWCLEGVAVGEPVFIQRENKEHDSILMVLLYDTIKNRSGLAIISSESLKTIATVWLSCVFPPGLHGQFFQDD